VQAMFKEAYRQIDEEIQQAIEEEYGSPLKPASSLAQPDEADESPKQPQETEKSEEPQETTQTPNPEAGVSAWPDFEQYQKHWEAALNPEATPNLIPIVQDMARFSWERHQLMERCAAQTQQRLEDLFSQLSGPLPVGELTAKMDAALRADTLDEGAKEAFRLELAFKAALVKYLFTVWGTMGAPRIFGFNPFIRDRSSAVSESASDAQRIASRRFKQEETAAAASRRASAAAVAAASRRSEPAMTPQELEEYCLRIRLRRARSPREINALLPELNEALARNPNCIPPELLATVRALTYPPRRQTAIPSQDPSPSQTVTELPVETEPKPQST
jgi:hypothetical protein